MPANPSDQLLQKMFKAPPVVKKTGREKQPTTLDPSWLRSGFEGGLDTILGALGVGPDTQMNKVGSMLGMALPLGNKIGRYPELNITPEMIPVQNRLAMGMSPNKNAIYDEAGRFLAHENPIDSVYAAHVASSRNKNIIKKGITPSQQVYERIMQKQNQ